MTLKQVKEVSVRYDAVCGPPVIGPVNATAQCTLQIRLPEMKAPVYFYYKLENFYQNHRRYVKSRNDDQLAGKVLTKFSQFSISDPIPSLFFFALTNA